jgi:hypothetical protein
MDLDSSPSSFPGRKTRSHTEQQQQHGKIASHVQLMSTPVAGKSAMRGWYSIILHGGDTSDERPRGVAWIQFLLNI